MAKRYFSVINGIGLAKKQILRPRIIVWSLNGEFQIRPRIWDRPKQVHGTHRYQRQIRCVGRARIVFGAGTALRNDIDQFKSGCQPAHIHDIGLEHINHVTLDHIQPMADVAVLLTTGNINREGMGDFAGPIRLPVGAGFLVVYDAISFEHFTNFDRLRNIVTAVGINHFHNIVTQGFWEHFNDFRGSARPLVDASTALRSNAEFEGVKPVIVPQPAQSFGFFLRADVSPHG